MDRACAIDNIVTDVKEIIGVGRTSARSLPNQSNNILLPVGGMNGNNEKLANKKNTLEWAKSLQKTINSKYKSIYYGSIIDIDDNRSDGTVVKINITTALIDGYMRKYNDAKLFNKDLTVDKKNIIREEMITLFMDYAKENGIKVKFVEAVLDENGNDVNAYYDSFTKIIKIKQGLESTDVFPEELAHHLTLALGEDHIAVKRAFNLISRLDYKGILGKEYVDAYNGDENLLKHEFLGKYIAKFLANPNLPNELNSENGIKLWDTIKNLLNRFISLFNPNFNIESRLEYLSKELGSKIVRGELVGNTDLFLKMYNKSKFDKLIDKDVRKQYVYYTGRIKKLSRDLNKYDNKDPQYIKIKAEIDSINEALREWTKNKNKQGIINLANNTLNVIQEYLNEVFSQPLESRKIDNIEETIKILNLFKDLEGVMDRVPTLLKQAKELGKQSIVKDLSRVLDKEVKLDIFDEIDTDMFVGGTWFGTLSDIKNKLGKAIGLLIKEAQGKVERDNKKSFSELNKQVDALQKYQNSRGIKGQDIYKVFIQSYRNTTVITKPWTTEFYNLIQDSFKSENGKEIRKSFATYDSVSQSWIPKDKAKYTNKNYEIIQKTPELKAFYDYFRGEIKKINDKLPIQKDLNEDFIPNVFERSLVDIFKSDKDIMSKLGDSVNHMLETNDWGKEASFLFDEALEKDQVPLKYLGNLPEDVKSKDLGASLLKFMYFANSYEHMNEILPKTRLLQDIIQEQEFVKSGDPNTVISGRDSNINTMVEAFIKMQVLGEMKKDNEKYAPYIDAGLKYTSLLRIGLNPFNAITNVIIGNIGNLVEATGGRFYTTKDYLKAIKIFSAENLNSESKLHKLILKFNPLMELEDYENLENIRVGSEQYKDKIKSLMYAPQRIGEKQMQTSTMIALMLNNKVKTKEGVEINMWEAFKEDGEWNTELMGYEFTEDMIFKITNKIQRINQMIHGRYSAKDAAAATQYSLFRAAFQFKKWIPAAIEARFGSKRYDDRLGEEIEGRYHSYVKGFNLMLAKLKGDIEAIEENRFTDLDIYNMRKNTTEVILLVATMLMAWGFDDDKKRKDPSYKYMMAQLNQISGDLMFFYNPNKMVDTAAGSLPLAKTMKDLTNVIVNIPSVFTGDKYMRGRYKGENRELASLLNVTPLAKPIADVARLWNNDPFIKR